ncbi:AmmeMemoRadiSam system protein A [Ramlibacter sp. 2FC]|uniref:AmmeMemoRadiSam system protein A n=1 Tax=Ramlibacter sp. 2FC TaxID=2502188 RepID=UPI0010F785D4|nr:AmmeMemoRadiSam system protein A [Ramlibacter sp. 2FC]
MQATEQGALLLAIARRALERELGEARHLAEDPPAGAPWLDAPGASFVTLMQRNRLRGCIGTLDAHRPLCVDVAANAVAAALRDTRFPPLAARELAQTDIEVSLLSAPEPVAFDSEAGALAQLEPGVHGVVFEFGAQRSTFLPQVWQQLPDAADFMAQLKRKAGLAPDFWARGVRLSCYRVRKWKETELAARGGASREVA